MGARRFSPQSGGSASLKAIHVARRALGLDDDDYRAVLERVTGKRSSADMTEAERQAVLDDFRRLGFTGGSKSGRARLEGRFAAKLQALWIAGWNLGLMRNRDDKALIAFVRHQTGIDHVRFLHHPDDAAKAIEALKGWLARDGGVDWTTDRTAPAWTQANGYRIAIAQSALLRERSPHGLAFPPLGQWLLAVGLASPPDMDRNGWIEAMNRLGRMIRDGNK